MIQSVMTAYMYIQIAIIVIQMVWKCEEAEFELAAKRELRSCHYLGSYCSQKIMLLGKQIGCLENKESYCCFSSPLARIIQEQGRPQLGMGWGTPEGPNCQGFTVEQIALLDFALMDLSEWIAILAIADKLPQSLQSADTNLTITKLTSAQTPVSGTTQPVDTPTLITNALPDPTSGEAARANIRSGLGF